MKIKEIIDTLKEAGAPLTTEELAKKTSIPMPRLRTNLYRLQEEGKIESKEEEGKLKWKTETSNPAEEKYEKMTRKHT